MADSSLWRGFCDAHIRNSRDIPNDSQYRFLVSFKASGYLFGTASIHMHWLGEFRLCRVNMGEGRVIWIHLTRPTPRYFCVNNSDWVNIVRFHTVEPIDRLSGRCYCCDGTIEHPSLNQIVCICIHLMVRMGIIEEEHRI